MKRALVMLSLLSIVLVPPGVVESLTASYRVRLPLILGVVRATLTWTPLPSWTAEPTTTQNAGPTRTHAPGATATNTLVWVPVSTATRTATRTATSGVTWTVIPLNTATRTATKTATTAWTVIPLNTPTRTKTPAPTPTFCKYCSQITQYTAKPCGDNCIPWDWPCTVGPGCACD